MVAAKTILNQASLALVTQTVSLRGCATLTPIAQVAGRQGEPQTNSLRYTALPSKLGLLYRARVPDSCFDEYHPDLSERNWS